VVLLIATCYAQSTHIPISGNASGSLRPWQVSEATKGTAMPEDQILQESETVVNGESPLSPAEAPANALKLTLVPGQAFGSAAPLTLYGYFNLEVKIAGRYSGRLPGPIRVVAVAQKTGRVYVSTLTKQDDIPPMYRGDAAPPSIVREGPNGPSSEGISESGFFTVDLKRHLGLPDAADTYDVFLWLENVVSDLVSAAKPAERGEHAGNVMFNRPSSIATTRSAPKSELLELFLGYSNNERYVRGRVGHNRVSIIAYSVVSGQVGWTVLQSDGDSGMEFFMKASELIPGSHPDERILAFAIADGKRSSLLDSSAQR
jgi:hypothetical protein